MNIKTKLRPWQRDALQKCIDWLLEKRLDRHFVLNAAPAAGKTIAACEIAREDGRVTAEVEVRVGGPRRADRDDSAGPRSTGEAVTGRGRRGAAEVPGVRSRSEHKAVGVGCAGGRVARAGQHRVEQ